MISRQQKGSRKGHITH